MMTDKPKMHIASCSFGKDSIATILLALEHNEPLDRVVFAEVMFDNNRNISGESPEHIEWIRNVAVPKLEALGVKVDIVRSKDDYVKEFYKVRGSKTKNPDRVGKHQGFLIAGFCKLNSVGKVKPIRDYIKAYAKNFDIVQYVGIAVDEPIRLQRLKEGRVSLLAKYNYTEKMAMSLCEKYGLVSPIYQTGTRGGCWFCPNASVKGYSILRKKNPHLWEELKILDKVENKVSIRFKRDLTLSDLERKMDDMEKSERMQLSLF